VNFSGHPEGFPLAKLPTKTADSKDYGKNRGSQRELPRKPLNHTFYGRFTDVILSSEMLVDALLGYTVMP
jgi:hypothetical protein